MDGSFAMGVAWGVDFCFCEDFTGYSIYIAEMGY